MKFLKVISYQRARFSIFALAIVIEKRVGMK